jgi:cytoskeletal protein CcmA (bactofilin family)
MAQRSIAIVLLLACAAVVHGAEKRMGSDVFIAGGSVTLHDPVGGDLFAAGGTLDIDAAVGGDAVAAGGKVRLGAEVGQSVYAAGGQVSINGKVGHNLRVAGGHVEIGPKADVAGNVSAAGGHVRIYGAVRGHVQAAGGRLLIDGPIGGDVSATSGQVTLGPQARIAGKLRYRSGEALNKDPAAQVSGGIELLTPSWGDAASQPPARPPHEHGVAGIGWFWTAGLIVLAALWLALAPGISARLGQALRQRPAVSVLLGFVWLVCVPVLTLLLLLTIIGIPLALFVVAAYFALLPLAYAAAAAGLGDWALARWQAARASSIGWRIGAAALMLVLLNLLGRVPWLGTPLAVAVLLAGLGAMLLLWRKPAPAAA